MGDIDQNVEQAVPFFRVANIQESLQFYVDGLGFEMTKKWIDDGVLRFREGVSIK
jgi:catechol 2,3-dioxygenase-like lactoylglutathione lyase family enzyme